MAKVKAATSAAATKKTTDKTGAKAKPAAKAPAAKTAKAMTFLTTPLTKALAKELTRNDAWTDVTIFQALASPEFGAYNEASRQILAQLSSLDEDAALARARELCDLALTHPDPNARNRIGAACLPVLIKAGDLPAKYEGLASIAGAIEDVRLVFEALPLERRLALLREDLAKPGASAARTIELLDLAPAATSDVLALYQQQGRPQWALLADRELDEQAARNPEIAEILETFRDGIRTGPKAEAGAGASGPFTFADPKTIMISGVGSLDALGLAQWRVAAGAFIGGDVKTTAQFLAKLHKDGAPVEDAEMRRWKVLRGGEHVYDVWIVWADNGSVFPAGQKVSAGVNLVKSSWRSIDRKPASEQLAKDLAASEPAGLWDVAPKP